MAPSSETVRATVRATSSTSARETDVTASLFS